MKNPNLLLNVTQYLARKLAGVKQSDPKNNAGYTLLEILVVVIMIGLIATISAPSWQGFMTRQRVSAANDVVLKALQEAQSQAKKTKQDYSVTVRVPQYSDRDNVPEIAVHLANSVPSNDSPLWKSLGQDLALNSKQIWIGTNATGANQAGTNISSPTDRTKGTTVVTFDLLGALQTSPRPNLGNKGLIIAVAQPQGNNLTQPVEGTTRCVKVTYLLGTIEIGRNPDQCKAN